MPPDPLEGERLTRYVRVTNNTCNPSFLCGLKAQLNSAQWQRLGLTNTSQIDALKGQLYYCSNPRLAKSEKWEFTPVNNYFYDKRNKVVVFSLQRRTNGISSVDATPGDIWPH
jgi:hypothetical protein